MTTSSVFFVIFFFHVCFGSPLTVGTNVLLDARKNVSQATTNYPSDSKWELIGVYPAEHASCRFGKDNSVGTLNVDYTISLVGSDDQCKQICIGSLDCKAVEISPVEPKCKIWTKLPSSTVSGTASCLKLVRIARSTTIFGDNHFGQLGLGNLESQNVPHSFPSPPGDFDHFSAGQYHTIVLDHQGIVWTFGNNMYGQLGTGSYSNSNIPTKVQLSLPLTIIKVAAGGTHSLILTNDGDVYSFGNNAHGQLCNGNQGGSQTLPAKIKNLPPIGSIAAGWGQTILLADDGSVYVCGRNADGELGLGDTVNRLTPVKNPFLSGGIDIACGSKHSLVLTSNSQVFSFGSNSHGQLCRQANNLTIPTQIQFAGTAFSVSGGMFHSAFVVMPRSGSYSNKNAVVCGQNLYGQLGTNLKNDLFVPYPISAISTSVRKVVVGNYHTVVLTDHHEVFAFGRNYDGQLGNGDYEDSSVLEYIPFPSTPIDIFAGGGVTAVKV
eukprot:c20209_g1_i1.p1 GENE.c20209_g1_i1~~c20209_g1_i1.p1  ORF type:complete len:493 (+),score=195.51 c20209_g1_i1:38-1516(+)